jgi:hypothetical protein
MLYDGPETTESEYVDFAYYNEVISADSKRPPGDVPEPCLWTLTNDTARALNEKKTHAAYDEDLHIDCYAFFDNSATTAVNEDLDALSNGPPLST